MSNDQTPAADRGSECNDLLGPPVPDSALVCLHAYGDSRADDDGRSGLRIGEAILALRRWAADLQAAERERCARICEQTWVEPGDLQTCNCQEAADKIRMA